MREVYPVLFNGQGDYICVIDTEMNITSTRDAQIPSGCLMKFITDEMLDAVRKGARMTASGNLEDRRG